LSPVDLSGDAGHRHRGHRCPTTDRPTALSNSSTNSTHAPVYWKTERTSDSPRANNEGIARSSGRYVLILNPDTHHPGSRFGEVGRLCGLSPRSRGVLVAGVLNPDGSFQHPARPFPTIWRSWIAALYLRALAYVSDLFISDTYTGWKGMTQRPYRLAIRGVALCSAANC